MIGTISAIMTTGGILYHFYASWALFRLRRRERPGICYEAVSILKPVRGRDIAFYEAIRSHALVEYQGDFELLFGVSDPGDAAVADIERLQAEFPNLPIRLIQTSNDAPNGKVGSLEILAREAKHDVLVLSDSDIRVTPDYLNRVVSLLRGQVGLVTCLYRGIGRSWPTLFEAMSISTEFAPSVLVADRLCASHFAFGSTIALRREDLDEIGGFASVRNYLADDYQLGARIHEIGKKVRLADIVVETSMGDGGWLSVWKHQVRWSRTVRVSNPIGYAGYLITQVTFWSLLAALNGHMALPIFGILMRLLSAFLGVVRMRDARTLLFGWFLPLRDLFGTLVWAAGLMGSTVEWRGLRFRLRRDGTIQPKF